MSEADTSEKTKGLGFEAIKSTNRDVSGYRESLADNKMLQQMLFAPLMDERGGSVIGRWWQRKGPHPSGEGAANGRPACSRHVWSTRPNSHTFCCGRMTAKYSILSRTENVFRTL